MTAMVSGRDHRAMVASRSAVLPAPGAPMMFTARIRRASRCSRLCSAAAWFEASSGWSRLIVRAAGIEHPHESHIGHLYGTEDHLVAGHQITAKAPAGGAFPDQSIELEEYAAFEATAASGQDHDSQLGAFRPRAPGDDLEREAKRLRHDSRRRPDIDRDPKHAGLRRVHALLHPGKQVLSDRQLMHRRSLPPRFLRPWARRSPSRAGIPRRCRKRAR